MTEMTIPDQVKLPLSIAVSVVSQGLRIRFGRSLITIMGVALGIAFLMSILTSQIIKQGVEEEEQLRKKIDRMYNFLLAEIGPPEGRTLGVIQTGELSEAERRLFNRIADEGLERFKWSSSIGLDEMLVSAKEISELMPAADVGADASAVVVAGQGETPNLDWAQIMLQARQPVIARTRQSTEVAGAPAEASIVALERKSHPDEVARAEKEAGKRKFRNGWIIVISLLVTVIGISNAMLMSVTERFREIGTMKCLGSLSAFIRRIFLIESSFMGTVGGIFGSLTGCLFSVAIYGFIYGFPPVMLSMNYPRLIIYFGLSIVAGIVLSVVAAIPAANMASSMTPADALRTNI